MIVTPFDPTLAGEAGSQTNWQQLWTGPVLSSKELARLRRDISRPQSTDALLSGPSSAAIPERGAATSSSEAQRLHSEVESLRREMQELRAERFEAPPGYASEDGDVRTP